MSINENLFSNFCDLLARELGLNFHRERWTELEKGLIGAAQDFGFSELDIFFQWLAASTLTQKQVQVLARYLTIGETYFFRETKMFQVLEKQFLPDYLASRRKEGKRLQIWSAGCSTGEEPYSLAILLSKLLPDMQDWNIHILATDINPEFLRKATEGVYNNWSFRDTPTWVKEGYFQKIREGYFKINPSIKNMVSFSYFNLVNEASPMPTKFDLVFCRNVLIYFVPEEKQAVIQRLCSSLASDGWMVMASGEGSATMYSGLKGVYFDDAVFFKKAEIKSLTSSFSDKKVEELFEYKHPTLPEPVYAHSNDDYKQFLYPEEQMTGELYQKNQENSSTFNREDQPLILARTYANQGRLAEARELCEKIEEANKFNPGFHYLLASILQEQNLYDEAILSLRRLLYLEQGFVLGHFALGRIYLDKGNPVEAERCFNNVRKILSNYNDKDVLPESDGITVGRLLEMMAAITRKGYKK